MTRFACRVIYMRNFTKVVLKKQINMPDNPNVSVKDFAGD